MLKEFDILTRLQEFSIKSITVLLLRKDQIY